MKQTLLILSLVGTCFYTSAQVVTNCQTTYLDTLKYVEQAKTSILQAESVNTNNDAFSPGYGYAGYGQRFEAPDSVKVVGFSFSGFVFSGASDTVVCRLYSADGFGMPGTQIDSAIYTVPLVANFSGPMDSDLIKNYVIFGAGHVLEGDYIITVENFSFSDMYLVRNTDGDGAAEDLCLLYYRGSIDPSFDGWYSTFSFGAGWNFDMNFKPIIEYALAVETTGVSDTICSADTFLISSNVTFDDSVLYNKMYNPNYATYLGYGNNSSFDYGDGSVDGLGSHVYSVSGNYTVMTTDILLATGWTNTQFEITCGSNVYVKGANLGMDTTMCRQDMLVLYPGQFDTYSWNTGQTTDSIIAGPILNSGIITYTVEVTSASCNSSASITITFDNCLEVEEQINTSVSIYPNPANMNLTINSEFNRGAELIIYDNLGKIVLSDKLSQNQQTLDVSRLHQGMYYLIISNNEQVVRKKLEILR